VKARIGPVRLDRRICRAGAARIRHSLRPLF
jgi:hypothetical protein